MNPTRRNILRAGAASLALPLLDFNSSARADQATVPTRFVVFFTGMGALNRIGDIDSWTPPTLANGALDLSSSRVLSPLVPLQDKLIVTRGIDNRLREFYTQFNGHLGTAHSSLSAALPETAVDAQRLQHLPLDQQAFVNMDSSRCTGPSIDHYLASKLNCPAPINLHLLWGEAGKDAFHKVTLDPDGFNSRGDVTADPIMVFKQYIANANAPPLTRLDRIRSKRHSVLDAVSSSFNDLYAKVGAEDKLRLQQHAQRISEIETALASDTLLACASPSQVLPSTYFPPGTHWSLQPNWEHGVWTAQIDNLVAMLKCGQRRVLTINNEQSEGPEMPFLASDPDVSAANQALFPISPKNQTGWHALTHAGGAHPVLVEGFRYYTRKFKYLLDQMNAVVEPNGKTMLDNSCVMWMTEFGDAATHLSTNLPVILAGGAQGRLKTGRFLNVLKRDGQPVQYTTNDLYVSLLNVFGFDDKTFGWTGDASLNHGGIPGLA